jgi:hypothetical protein
VRKSLNSQLQEKSLSSSHTLLSAVSSLSPILAVETTLPPLGAHRCAFPALSRWRLSVILTYTHPILPFTLPLTKSKTLCAKLLLVFWSIVLTLVVSIVLFKKRTKNSGSAGLIIVGKGSLYATTSHNSLRKPADIPVNCSNLVCQYCSF